MDFHSSYGQPSIPVAVLFFASLIAFWTWASVVWLFIGDLSGFSNFCGAGIASRARSISVFRSASLALLCLFLGDCHGIFLLGLPFVAIFVRTEVGSIQVFLIVELDLGAFSPCLLQSRCLLVFLLAWLSQLWCHLSGFVLG